MASFLGETHAGYSFDTMLGEGPRGTVYRGTSLRDAEPVVLRVLPDDLPADRISQLLGQLQMLERLQNPHLLHVYKVFKSHSLYCIAMRDARGGSLRGLLDREGRQLEVRAAAYIHQAALAVAAAAAVGVGHRDLRPENLLLTKNGRLVVGGFGLAPEQQISSQRMLVGSPLYQAPETCMQNAAHDQRSDLYALGCVLFELLAGVPPYQDPSAANLLVKHLMDPIPTIRQWRPETSQTMADLLESLLAKDANDRPQSGEELALRLAALAGNELKGGDVSSRNITHVTYGPLAASSEALKASAAFEIPVPDSDIKLEIGDVPPLRAADPTPVIEISVSASSAPPAPVPEAAVRGIELHDSDVKLEVSASTAAPVQESASLSEAAALPVVNPTVAPVVEVSIAPAAPAAARPARIRRSGRHRVGGSLSELPKGRSGPPRWLILVAGTGLLMLLFGLLANAQLGGAGEPTEGPAHPQPRAPRVRILTPRAGRWVTEQPFEVRVSVEDLEPRLVEVQGKVANAVSGGLYSRRLSLPEGAHQLLLVRVTGPDDAVYVDSLRVSVDTEPPSLRLLHPADLALLRSESLWVRLAVEGAVRVEIGGEPAELVDGEYRRLLLLEEGRFREIEVFAYDAVGHRVGLTLHVHIDSTPPSVTHSPPRLEGLEVVFELDADEELAAYSLDGKRVAVRGLGAEVRFALPAERSRFELEVFDVAGNARPMVVWLSEDLRDTVFFDFFEAGIEAFEEERFQASIESFDACTVIYPEEPIPYLNLATAWCMLDSLDAGLRNLGLALENGEDDLAFIEENEAFDLIRETRKFADLMLKHFGIEPPVRGLFEETAWFAPTEAQRALARARGLPVAARNSMDVRVVLLPPGGFTMGSAAAEAGEQTDELRHEVTLTHPFYLGANEVSQQLWVQVMGSNPSRFDSSAELPVETVSWIDAVRFCNALSDIDGLTRAYEVEGENVRFLGLDSEGWRLPTEAEWEYASRAGTTSAFSVGRRLHTDQANFDGSLEEQDGKPGLFRDTTLPSGSFAPNPWGLYDMHGNVAEWCHDWYSAEIGVDAVDPIGPESGERHVFRGGCWISFPEFCRSACRSFPNLSRAHGYRGLRLARSLKAH